MSETAKMLLIRDCIEGARLTDAIPRSPGTDSSCLVGRPLSCARGDSWRSLLIAPHIGATVPDPAARHRPRSLITMQPVTAHGAAQMRADSVQDYIAVLQLKLRSDSEASSLRTKIAGNSAFAPKLNRVCTHHPKLPWAATSRTAEPVVDVARTMGLACAKSHRCVLVVGPNFVGVRISKSDA